MGKCVSGMKIFFYNDKKKIMVIQHEENEHRRNNYCSKKLVYELDDNNKTVSEMYWSNEIKSDFFSFVKETEIYRLLCKEKVYDVNIFWEET